MLFLLYEIFIPWIDPPPQWVKSSELLIIFQSAADTDTLFQLLMDKVSPTLV